MPIHYLRRLAKVLETRPPGLSRLNGLLRTSVELAARLGASGTALQEPLRGLWPSVAVLPKSRRKANGQVVPEMYECGGTYSYRL